MKKRLERFRWWLLGKLAPQPAPVPAALSDSEIADHARALLENPLYALVIRTASECIVRDWKRTRPDDREARDFLYIEQMALRRFDITARSMIGRIQFDRSMKERTAQKKEKTNG